MRSYRYKYSMSTAYLTLSLCIEGGWKYSYLYPMKLGRGDSYLCTLKHIHFDKISRTYWTFVSDFDRDNFVFSNMVKKKNRCCEKYRMRK